MPLPHNFALWSKSLRGAFLKGADAAVCGEPIDANPYEDKRTWRGAVTWSRAYRSAWRDGWEYARADRCDALITLQYRVKK